MTKSFNNKRIKSLHNYNIKGLIDRDYMTENEIQSYKESNIYTLDVAEVENLYLLEDIIKLVAENQALDPDETFNNVKKFIFEEFYKEYDLQLCSICSKEIRHKLQCYTKPQENSVDALKLQIEKTVNSINIDQIYNQHKQHIDAIIKSEDYNELLKIYNRKSIHLRVSNILKLSPNEYPKLILRLIKTGKKERIIGALKKHMPILDEN